MSYDNYGKLKALIVDDFDNFRMTVSKMLQDFGCQDVITAINGEDAMRLCRSRSFDLVLCDYNLGSGRNGHQILEELRSNNLLSRQSLFLLVSADSSKNIVLAAYDYEPDGYLTKPITGKALHQRLDRLLCQRDELMPIYRSLDHGDHGATIKQCQKIIASNSRYTAACQKILGRVLVDEGRLDEAEVLFKQVLEARPLDWAEVGLAKVKQLQGDFKTSAEWLKRVIEKNPFCMDAYDALIDGCRQQNDADGEQAALQRAVEMSPMSILRQESLAHIAIENNDVEVAAKALQKTVKLGKNSCHDKADNHLAYARTTAALFSENNKLAADLSRDASKVLDEFQKKFTLSKDAVLQAKLVEVQLHAGKGDSEKARAVLKNIESTLEDSEQTIDTNLDYINSLKAIGQKVKANQVLAALVETYRHDEVALQKIDKLLEEPLSDDNRQRVAALNAEGIGAYKNREYKQAIECFSRAKRLFPNHIGVQLNLVQALAGEMRDYGVIPQSMETCMAIIERVKLVINGSHKQFNRFVQLQDMVRSIEREVK